MNFFLDENKLTEIFRSVIDLFFIPRFNQLGMNATGEWIENLGVSIDDNSVYITGRDYTQQLDFGRPPGNKPPIAPLIEWAKAKFGYSEEEAVSIAYAVQNTIAEKGTTWYQQGGSNLMYVLSEKETIDYINRRIGDEIRIKLTNQLYNYAK